MSDKLRGFRNELAVFLMITVMVTSGVFGVAWANRRETTNDNAIMTNIISNWDSMFLNDEKPTKMLEYRLRGDVIRFEGALPNGEVKEYMYEGSYIDDLEPLINYSYFLIFVQMMGFVLVVFGLPISILAFTVAISSLFKALKKTGSEDTLIHKRKGDE